MAKPILPLALLLALAVPAAASAEIVRADLSGGDGAVLIKVKGKDKHKHKHHGKHRRGHDGYAYDQGYRDGQRDAHHRYARGQRLPYEYRDQVLYDYDDYGYPPPPHGSRYVRVGQDTYLTQIATGLILNAFLGGGY